MIANVIAQTEIVHRDHSKNARLSYFTCGDIAYFKWYRFVGERGSYGLAIGAAIQFHNQKAMQHFGGRTFIRSNNHIHITITSTPSFSLLTKGVATYRKYIDHRMES